MCQNDNISNTNINEQNEEGWTPLHIACWKGQVDLVRELLLHGANVNIKNNLGCIPLHYACVAGHLEIVKLLITNSDLTIRDEYGNYPYDVASTQEIWDLFESII
jgi:ankyrin repeat protein